MGKEEAFGEVLFPSGRVSDDMNLRIGNAPCSWGTLEFEGIEGETIGYAQMLDELVESGYEGTELGDWGFMPTHPDRLFAELNKRRLTLLGAFVPVALKDCTTHAQGEAEALKTATLLAGVLERSSSETRPFLVLADANGDDPTRVKNAGRISPEMGLSANEWETFAEGANRIGRVVKEETGLQTVFHHHCAGYVETPDEIQELMARTDPESLGLVFDTGHYAYAEGQLNSDAVMEGLDRFADRIAYVHFKDCNPKVAEQCRAEQRDYFEAVRGGVFPELGTGCVDFPGVLKWLVEHRYEGWALVEQDVLPGMGQPRESARRNRDYLRRIGV